MVEYLPRHNFFELWNYFELDAVVVIRASFEYYLVVVGFDIIEHLSSDHPFDSSWMLPRLSRLLVNINAMNEFDFLIT